VSAARPSFVGPHEGRELELLLAGTKPMARLHSETITGFASDLTAFQPHVESGRIIRIDIPNSKMTITNHYFCLPGEEWRIKLAELVNVATLSPNKGGFTTAELHRIDGWLLGYDKADIEAWLEWLQTRQKSK
jgi:hypothetical protein